MENAYLLTVRETCDALRIGRTNLYALIKKGQLQTVKIGCATRITVESIRALAAGDPAIPANDAAPAAERGAA